MFGQIAKKFKKIVLLKDELDFVKSTPTIPAIPGEKSTKKNQNNGQDYVRGLILASNITALAAKLAKCDGPISIDEIEKFPGCFSLPEINLDYQKLFAEAAGDSVAPEHYAARLNSFFGPDEAAVGALISGLFSYAACDSPINFDEIIFLKKISLALGLDNESFKLKLKNHMLPKGADAFEILAVDRKISSIDLKRAYRIAVQMYHPDLLASKMPIPEVVMLANERLATINDAYKEIMERRNFG